jgi:ABC-type antimicrobial peptide transport system permease subunit
LLGLGSSLLLGRVLGSLLYETQTADPLTWVAVALVLVATASAAAVVPAARALRLDPIRTLREE